MTLKSKIEELVNRFEARRMVIDNTLKSLNTTVNNADKAMISMKIAMDDMGDSFRELKELTEEIQKDYKDIKEFMNRLKNNFWIRLFGIK